MPISSLALYLRKEVTRLVLAHPYPEGRDVGTGLNLISPQPKPSLGLTSATQPPNGSSTLYEAPRTRVAMNGSTFLMTTEKQGPGTDATSATSFKRNGRG